MIEFTQYAGQFNSFRGRIVGLPQWARLIVAIFAIPGTILLALSILAFLVSILALLVLTVPVYVLLKRLTEPASIPRRAESAVSVDSVKSPGVRRVESTIVE
jgi:hypothetical protein